MRVSCRLWNGEVIVVDDGLRATLHTVIIDTSNISELASFYARGLGLPEPSPTGDNHLGFDLPNLYFGFDLVPEAGSERPGATSLWFEVSDLQATYQHLLSLGATDKYPPTQKPWSAVLAAAYDPDGTVLGLAQRGTLPRRV